MSEPEKLTIDDIMVMDQQNFDPIIAVWTEMAATDQTVTLLKATIEWARRQGRIIEVVPTKMAASADQSYTIAASDATGTVTKVETFAAGSMRGLAGLRFAESWLQTGRPIVDAGGSVTIRKA